jgi:hypothetical protein
VASAVLAVCAMPAAANAHLAKAAAAGQTPYTTTLNYAIRFYPRFINAWVAGVAPKNTLVGPLYGPDGLLTSQARLINAFNVDTVYAGSFDLDLSAGPEILTVPRTSVTFSMNTYDVWGNVFPSGIPTDRPGIYALTLSSWHGTLPPGVTRVDWPFAQTMLSIRADRYARSGSGYVNTIAAAKAFVRGLRLASVSRYEANPSTGRSIPLPQSVISGSEKVVTDTTMRQEPTTFLTELQAAMHSPATEPLTASDRALSSQFDRVFAAAQKGAADGLYGELSQIELATREADAMITNHYLSHVIPGTRWITFNDIGIWGTNYLDRDATSAYIYVGNAPTTSRYWDAFVDHNGVPLDTDTYARYQITFPKADLPDAKRFWSLTAYVGAALHPTPGPSNSGQRNVASYTPGLQTSRDGSVTIYIQPTRPTIRSRVPNWIYVPPHTAFSLLLRVYGVTGNTDTGKLYVPPDIKPLGFL